MSIPVLNKPSADLLWKGKKTRTRQQQQLCSFPAQLAIFEVKTKVFIAVPATAEGGKRWSFRNWASSVQSFFGEKYDITLGRTLEKSATNTCQKTEKGWNGWRIFVFEKVTENCRP